MTIQKFSDIVSHKQFHACASCDSHEYALPFPVTAEIESYLLPLGRLKYPLNQVAFIKIDNEEIVLQGRVGRITIKVKFKKKGAQRELLEGQLASYLSMVLDCEVVI